MTKENLITAINEANKIFNAIMNNYSVLKDAYLVLSSSRGQCKLTRDPLQILKDFPAMISESEFKEAGTKLIETIEVLEAELKSVPRGKMKEEIQKKIENASHLLNANLQRIEFKEDTFIEIRFEKQHLLDLIFKMQKDPLVSQVHTPQSQASVRIVLGTLIELAQQAANMRSSKG